MPHRTGRLLHRDRIQRASHGTSTRRDELTGGLSFPSSDSPPSRSAIKTELLSKRLLSGGGKNIFFGFHTARGTLPIPAVLFGGFSPKFLRTFCRSRRDLAIRVPHVTGIVPRETPTPHLRPTKQNRTTTTTNPPGRPADPSSHIITAPTRSHAQE